MNETGNITARPPRRFRFGPLWLELVLFTLVLGLCAFFVLAASPAGTRTLFQLADQLSRGALKVGKVEGSLSSHLSLQDVQWHGAKSQFTLDELDLEWSPANLLKDELIIDRLALGRLALTTTPSKTPIKLPDNLNLPFAVTVRSASLARLTLNNRLLAEDVMLTGQSDGHQHQLSLTHAATPWFDARAEVKLGGGKPFPVSGTLELDGQTEDASWQTNGTLGGELRNLSIIGDGSGGPNDIPPFRADFDLNVDPFASSLYALLKAGRLETRSVDLHVLSPHLPRTSLDISLAAQPEGPTVAAQIKLVNALAGTWQAARLPLAALDASVRLNAAGARIDRLDAQTSSGKIHVVGVASLQSLGLLAEMDHLALSQIGGPDVSLSGRVQLDGSPTQPRVRATVSSSNLTLDLEGEIERDASGRVLTAKHLLLTEGRGELNVNGRLKLSGEHNFDVAGHLAHFDPSRLSVFAGRPIPAGDLNGQVHAVGTVTPLAVHVETKIDDSRLNNRPLQGQANATITPGRVENVRVDLTLAANRLRADGAFGRPGDALRLEMAMPNLADIGTGFGGHLDAKLIVAGTVRRPTLDGGAHAENLHLPGDVSINRANLAARLDAAPNRPLDSPVSLKLDVAGLSVRTLAVDDAHLALYGTQASHGAELTAQGKLAGQGFNLLAGATGAMDAHGWHGRLERLENSGEWPVRLSTPTHLALTLAGGAVDQLDAVALGTNLHLVHADWQGAHFAATGSVTNLALAEWLGRLPEVKQRVSTDLVLSAAFDLHGDDKLGGSLKLERQSGDMLLRSDDPTIKPMPLRLSAARAGLDLNGDRATVSVDIKSDAFGTAAGHLTTQFVRTEQGWRPNKGAALDGRLDANMPSLAWIAPLLGPTAGVEGKLSAELTAGGQIGDPRWFGQVDLNGFALRLPEAGANWHDGSLSATLQGDTLELAQCVLKAGKGAMTARGRMSLRDTGPEGALNVKFDHFAALSRPDRNLVASGETNLAMQANALTLTGNLSADEGLIEFVKSNAPTLGSDITVKGQVEKVHTQSKAPPMTLRLGLDLGDRFHFKGLGVDTRLTGAMRVTASPTQRLGVYGGVTAEDGRYTAYGQNLVITRGVLTFQGPLDNPALDILAERKNLPLEVGVEVTGTAQAPRVALTSDQAMPDSEKLAWLVLGHGSTSTSGDTDVLVAAANALLSNSDAVGLRQQLASRLGLDDISVGHSTTGSNANTSSSSALPPGTVTSAANNSAALAAANASASLNSPLNGRVLSLGKRLSDNVYVSYEQSIDGIGYALKLTYQFTKRVSLALTAGQTSSVDVLYSWLFN